MAKEITYSYNGERVEVLHVFQTSFGTLAEIAYSDERPNDEVPYAALKAR